MEVNKKSGKKWIVYIGIAVALFACVVLYLLWEVKHYIDRVPEITPKASVEVSVGQTLSVEDMFDIECKGAYMTKLSIGETDISDAAVSPDRQTLYVGSEPGSIRILLIATGEVAETTDAENIIVVTMKE